MTIECSLSEKDLDRAIRLVELYKKDLDGKTSVFVDGVARTVEGNARNELSNHIWSGETMASLHTEKMANKGHTYTSRVIVGGAAVWLEFGTGVVANNCSPGEFVHPMAKELGMYGIGEYGYGLGSSPNGWYFDSDAEWANGTYNVYERHHTFGIPATLFMYHSAWAGRRALTHIAKGVFNTW